MRLTLSQRALASFPDYDAALEELSGVHMTQHREAEAIELLQKRNLHFPSSQSAYLLATALERAGRVEGAQTAFGQFERTAIEIHRPSCK